MQEKVSFPILRSHKMVMTLVIVFFEVKKVCRNTIKTRRFTNVTIFRESSRIISAWDWEFAVVSILYQSFISQSRLYWKVISYWCEIFIKTVCINVVVNFSSYHNSYKGYSCSMQYKRTKANIIYLNLQGVTLLFSIECTWFSE